MINPHELLEATLLDIENGIKTNITAETLAKNRYISSIHLQRLFKFVFEQTIGSYIKERKLTASLDCVLKTDMSILNVALEYGFEYEQSYIRAFKRVFGDTPGEIRKTGKIVKITPPLHLYDTKKIDSGILMKPVMVMVPQFYLIGKKYKVLYNDPKLLPAELAKQFWHQERKSIMNTINPDIYFGLTRIPYKYSGYTFYFPSVQVDSLDNVPQGLEGNIIEASMCVRYRYIGHHHYYDLNADIAQSMYRAIHALRMDENFRYNMYYNGIYYEKVDTSAYDGTYCQMEWFAPICAK
ncbi:MAG: helix-turn-helix domain-containing protein [Oscillospiraceae bacterium]|jgi:AraC family transcriptional regulator|nr:helix-turn-helix domain-containing protein [Oscillospiraceae bacterium]